MKKLFLAILILSSVCAQAFCALPSALVWEIRTSGNSTNGGCYDSGDAVGTDYSQQDSAQLSLSDLAMTTGGTTLTSSTGGFTSAMVDNCIQISSGTNFTAGFYEITAYTDTNTVTIDRDATDGSNGSGGNGSVGGAIDNLQDVEDAHPGGDIAYIKYGTYTDTGTDVLKHANSNTIRYIGYYSTRDDFPFGDNRPSVDGESAREPLDTNSQSNHYYSNIIFKNSSGSGVNNSYGTTGFFNCRSTNNATHGFVTIRDVPWFLIEADNNGADGIYTNRSDFAGSLVYAYLHDNSSDGYWHNSQYGIRHMSDIISESNSNDGIALHNSSLKNFGGIFRGILYNNTSVGLRIASTSLTYTCPIFNMAFISNGTGVSVGDDAFIYEDYNSYYDNTTDVSGLTKGSNDVSSNPLFNNASDGDFTLSSSSSPLIGAGFDMSVFSTLTTDFNVNIGIDQGDHSSGGSSEHSYGFSN